MRHCHLITTLLTTTAMLGLTVSSLTACSSGSHDASESADPESYYTDYPDPVTEDLGVTAESQGSPGRRDWPGPLEDNTFVDAGTSGFVATAEDPRSTFSLDADTGSYGVARELLTGGNRPPAESIRPEEWVNAFDYGYDAPPDRDLGVYVDSAAAPHTSDGTRLVRVGIKAREVSDDDRPPAAITMVVDTSGSMDIRERLGLVKSSLALLAENLHSDDTISIVTYGNTARATLPATPVRQKQRILDAIDQLHPSGSTNMEDGLRLGYQEARKSFREGAINTVILSSDGVANVGSTGSDDLVGMIRESGAEGIKLVTVGYGMGNYNDHLMEQLADDGDGFYAYVDTYEEAEKLYVEDLTGTLSVVAEEARAQVEFDPERVASYRLVGYENRQLADDEFTDTTVDAGEIGAGHDVTALYEVRLTSAARTGDRVGTVNLGWRPEGADDFVRSATPIYADAAEEPSSSLRMAATVANLAQVLKGSQPVAGREVTLSQLAAEAQALASEDVPGASGLTVLIADAQAACGDCRR